MLPKAVASQQKSRARAKSIRFKKGSKQMKAQDLENMACMDLFDRAMSDYAQCEHACDVSRLRSCRAWVYETDNFYLLLSYDTFIGAIEKSSGYGADALRHEYGYTATSVQHLAKFFSDYGNRQKVYRWYN